MIRLFKNWYTRHFSEPGTIEFALVLAVIFIMIYYFMWLVGPIVVALCIAYCLDGSVNHFIKKYKMSRTLASSIVMGLFVSACALFTVLLVPIIVDQALRFYSTVISLSQEAVSNIYHTNEDVAITANDIDIIIASQIYKITDTMPDSIAGIFSEQTILNTIRNTRVQFLDMWARIMKANLMPSVVNVVSWAVYLIIVPIFTFLVLCNKRDLQKRAQTYLLPNNQDLMKKFWPSMNEQISSYIKGKILHIIIISIVNTIALLSFNLNYSVLLGVGVGLSVVIPYVGAVLIGVPVLFVAVFQFGFSSMLIYLLLVYVLIQLLDSNVLTPMLFSKAMNLDAFSILTAILIFGQLWGFWGVFLAIPLATLLKTLIVNWPSQDKLH